MNIVEVHNFRKFGLAVVFTIGLLMFAVTNSGYPSGGVAPDEITARDEIIEWLGIVAIAICILGRTWCALYIGGRKFVEFVTVGPYSVSRNPLYFFSILGAVGVGAQLGSVVSGTIFGALTWVVFRVVVLREECALAKRYGADFARYEALVPRFLPNPRLWRDAPTLTVMPLKVLRTFADAMVFVLAVPIAQAFEQLQNLGLLPVLLRLP